MQEAAFICSDTVDEKEKSELTPHETKSNETLLLVFQWIPVFLFRNSENPHPTYEN